MQNNLLAETSSCPSCGAPKETFHKDVHYERDFICYEAGTPVYHRITIYCVECSSCGHSHALEPSVIVPYSSFSLTFLMNIIYAKLTKRFLTDSILLKRLSELSDILETWKNFMLFFPPSMQTADVLFSSPASDYAQTFF